MMRWTDGTDSVLRARASSAAHIRAHEQARALPTATALALSHHRIPCTCSRIPASRIARHYSTYTHAKAPVGGTGRRRGARVVKGKDLRSFVRMHARVRAPPATLFSFYVRLYNAPYIALSFSTSFLLNTDHSGDPRGSTCRTQPLTRRGPSPACAQLLHKFSSEHRSLGRPPRQHVQDTAVDKARAIAGMRSASAQVLF